MKMIYIDDSDPVGTLEPSFPSRDVTIKRNVDAKDLYELISEIGRGKFGTVYKCKEKSTGLELAAKFVPIPKREDRRSVEREVEIMNSLQHPLIIQLYAAYEFQKMMCVVLELIEGGELFDRVVDDDFVLTERVCAVFMRQVCEAMQFIHRNNILHLDLKPENILCLTKEGNRIKIIDFGLARKYDPDKKLQILFGTPEFVAPEVVNFDSISYGTDMWSVGVICYVLLSGLSPFMGENDIETMANVTIAKYDFDDEAFNNVSSEALDFISKLLIKDMSLRMSASECLEHNWLERRPKSAPPTTIPLSQPQTISKPAAVVSLPSSTPAQLIQQQLPPTYTTTPPSPPPVTPEQPPPPAPLSPATTVQPPSTPSPPTTIIQPPTPSLPVPETTTTTTTTVSPEISEPPSSSPPPRQPTSQPSPSTPASEKKELLEQTKDNLRTFIERWEQHPNSPYVFETGSHLIAPIHPESTISTKGSSNVSSRACSPSPCGSIYSDDNSKDQTSEGSEKSEKNKEKLENKKFKEYLHSFERRNSDTNYILGRHPIGERINLAEEIRKLSDHLLMLAEINTKLGKENDEGIKQRTNSTSEKLETIQESTTTETSSNELKPEMKTSKTTIKRSTSVIDTPKDTNKTSISKTTKVSMLSVRLQKSLDQTPQLISNDNKQDIKNKSQNIEDRATKLINGFKQQLLSTSASSTNLVGGVPWPITNKRTKFRINQMSRDVPVGSPDTHQPIDLEDAANTTKDCLLQLLEKYNEGKWRNRPSGRHQSISVDWNVSENLEYQSMSSINAFFRRHSSKGNYVRQLQAQLEAKSKPE